MSSLIYIASDTPLEEITNPHYKTLSINEALAIGLEIPQYVLEAGFDREKPGRLLWHDGRNKVDGFADDFSIRPCDKLFDMATEKEYCAYLELARYTEGCANRLIEYLEEQLSYAAEVELWHIWRGYEDFLRIKKVDIPIDELTADDIRELYEIDVGGAPSIHYCFRITSACGMGR